MYRFLFPLFFLCFAGPLWACSCGGTLTYAPIVALPPSNTAFVRTVETIETGETVAPERAETRTADKPAIPKSIWPDSIAVKPRPILGRLQYFELPAVMQGEQTVSKPAVPVFGGGFTNEQPPEGDETKQEENYPPESNIGGMEEETENAENTENSEDTADFRGQSTSRRGEEGLHDKPDPPGGPSDVSIPGKLTEESSEKEKENTSTPPKNRDQEDQDQESSTLPGNVSGGPGSMDSQSWTITALVLLSAISTVAFLCTVFVVGEYRKRWLNAIMSQNGIVPSFQGGLYDIPTLSIGYRRYED